MLLPSYILADTIESEFEKFFKMPYKSNLVKVGAPAYAQDTSLISIVVSFDIKEVVRVLIVQSRTPDCYRDPAKKASYLFDPAINVSKVEFRVRTSCNFSRVEYIAYVQTKDGSIFSGAREFSIAGSREAELKKRAKEQLYKLELEKKYKLIQ